MIIRENPRREPRETHLRAVDPPGSSIRTMASRGPLGKMTRWLHLSVPIRKQLRHFHHVLDGVLGGPAPRVIVLAGEGVGFCAGLDLKSVLDAEGLSQLDVASGYELQLCLAGLVKRLRATDATVIAAVQGVAVGAGMALTLAADIRFASEQAAFHIGAVRIGITAGECGISYHLPRLMNHAQVLGLMTQDFAEAALAFVKKRPPIFHGQ